MNNNNLNETIVDIILPNYNSSSYLEETLNSVINQSFNNWNLKIIDDNSDKKTKDILRNYSNKKNIEIVWLKKNKGAGFCRNLALRKSKSKYIAFIDSDDIWDRDKLKKQISFMEKNNFSFTYTNYQPFKDVKKKIYLKEIKPKKQFTFSKFVKDTSIATSTMIVKKSLIGNIKFIKTKICEDYFFKCKILKKTNANCLLENLTHYRIRKNSLQNSKIKNLYWIWYINKNYNKMNFLQNLISMLFISLNSIKKYGFK